MPNRLLQSGFVIFTFVLLLLPASIIHAQAPCGHITGPVELSDPSGPQEVTAIENCADPFGVTTDPINPYSVTINGQVISPGSTVELPAGRTSDISYIGTPGLSHISTGIFKHVGNNYEYVNQERPEPTEADYRAFAETYFGTPAERDLYLEITVYNFENTNLDQYFLNSETGEAIIDAATGETVESRYLDFLTAFDAMYANNTLYLEVGTYTMLFNESQIEVTQRTIWDSVKDFIIPTAYAQCQLCIPDRFYTITFTIAAAPVEPVGASSILFLPGIQASRLYKESFFGTFEDRIWPPNAALNEDIYDLSMSASGVSEEEIYTRDIIDTSAGVGDVHAKFKIFLDGLDAAGTIDDWEPYAYDWRYSVADVAQNGTQYKDEIKDAVDEIERLAENSFSGKVTIIGHSNGGLLAKVIMRRLESEGKAILVDKIVLLASPQLGTPKAIGTLLHGYDQTDSYGGFIINAQSVREVINNVPGAYGLLPSEKYFEGLDVPLVTFNDTAVTAPYRQTYGAGISSYADYVRFLRGEDGFDRDVNNPPAMPARLNSAMLDAALAMHDSQLDEWVAPAGVKVVEVVGTGLPTMKSVEYREIVENKCAGAGPQQVCTLESEIKPYAILTKYGDGTVVQRSAEGYGGMKEKYFINLAEVKNSFPTKSYVHHNIMETPPLQDLIGEIIVGTTTSNNQFVSASHTEFNDLYDVEMIDSPVRLLAIDTDGNQTGVVIIDGVRIIKQEIPGSQYFEFGDTKYLIVPKGTDRTTTLYGEDYGGYTLTTAILGSDDKQVVKTVLVNATTTPHLIAKYSNQNGDFDTVSTDLNGDGEVDYETSLDGELIEEEVLVTYPLLIAKVESFDISKNRKKKLIRVIKSAETYGNNISALPLYLKLEDELLQSAQTFVKRFVKKHHLTATEAVELQLMIQILKDKQ